MSLIDLIDRVVEGEDPKEIIETVEEADTGPKRTFRRPRKRRFSKKGAAFSSLTGKRKDPRRRLKARRAARRSRVARKRAAKRFAKSAKGKSFYRKLGKLSARLRRS